MTIDQGNLHLVPPPAPTSLKGEVICITGRPKEGPKKDLGERIRQIGGIWSENCTQSITLLVQCEDTNGGNKKRLRAIENGKPIMEETRFMELLRNAEQDQLN